MTSAPTDVGEISIRQATCEDSAIVLSLIDALADYEKLDRPTEDARQRLIEHGWGGNPRFEALIAEIDGTPAAYAIMFETYSTFLAQPTLYLEDLFVLPDFRRKGVAAAIFQRLAIEAQRRGCGRIEWSCLTWNDLGLAFYKQLGATQLEAWLPFRLTGDEITNLAANGIAR
jgi:GNAT superfamily N-acetyltransferase